MDAFAEIGLPRSPCLDQDDLDRRFDRLTRERHPDAGGGAEGFARLNEARAILESSARRWRHLLELEFPGTAIDGPLPGLLMDLFSEMSLALSRSDAVLDRKSAAASAVARALLSRDEMRAREELECIGGKIDDRFQHLESAAREWDRRPESLAALAREAAFLEKWRGLTREALVKLGM
jgi:curved DNA-binding protein CbpA